MKKRTCDMNGITLIALIITIIVIIILSSVVISSIIGNGTVEDAIKAREESDIDNGMEQINGALWDDGVARALTSENISLNRLVEIFESESWIASTEKVDEENRVTVINEKKYMYDIILDNGTRVEYLGKDDGEPRAQVELSTYVEGETNNKEAFIVANVTESKNGIKTIEVIETGEIFNYNEEKEIEKSIKVNSNGIYTIKVTTAKDKITKKKIEVTNITGINFSFPEWEGGYAKVKIEGNVPYDIQYKIGRGEWKKYVKGNYISEILNGSTILAQMIDNGNQVGGMASTTIIDDISPTVNITEIGKTTNSIEISVEAEDNETGMPTNPIYEYYIKEASLESYPAPSYVGNDSTYKFQNLKQNIEYTIKVITKDVGDNSKEITTTIKTDIITGEIKFEAITWNNGKANTRLTTTSNQYIQYQYNSESGPWTTGIAKGANVTLSNIINNTTVYARLWDGENASTNQKIEIKDSEKPTLELSATSIVAQMPISIKLKDSKTQVAYWGITNTATNPSSTSTTNTTNTSTIGYWYPVTKTSEITVEFTPTTANTFYIWVKDVAGNYNSKTVSVTASNYSIGTNKYTTLEAAVNAASTGATITLEKDVTDSSIVTIGKTLSINTNGKTLSRTSGITINSGGNLTIDGNGKIQKSNTGNLIINSGTLTLKNGTLNTSNSIPIYNTAAGTVNIQGGEVSSSSNAIYNASTGNVKISGGNVKSTSTYSIFNYSTGTVEISGGSITGYRGVYANANGTINIKNTAKITTSYESIYNNGMGKTNIITGTIESTSSIAIRNCGTGTITISGGTINSSGYSMSNEIGGTITFAGGTATSKSNLCIYNKAGGTINVSGGSANAGNYTCVYNNGTGKINVTKGKITSTTSYGVYDYLGGTIEISGGEINGSRAVHVAGNGTTTISGGILKSTNSTVRNYGTGTITISGGTITSVEGNGVYNYTTGKINITGGTIKTEEVDGYAIYNYDGGTITKSSSVVVVGKVRL